MNLDQPSRRKRGFVLTSQGLEKLLSTLKAFEDGEGKRLTKEQLSEKTRLDISTINKVIDREKAVDKRTLMELFRAFQVDLVDGDFERPDADTEKNEQYSVNELCIDGDMPSTVNFFGRNSELAELEQWIIRDHCRLIALLGMGGIGKTRLAAKIGQQIRDNYKENFKYIAWRSLRNELPLQELLVDLLKFLSNYQRVDLPKEISERIGLLITELRKHKCLLILDNFETVLQEGQNGAYKKGYEDYGQLLRRISEISHESCVILTSREKPKGIALQEGQGTPVRSLRLHGLAEVDAENVLKAQGLILSGAEEHARKLIHFYRGNPLALKLTSNTIQEVFDGNISSFLNEEVIVFDGIRRLVEQQFNRISDIEKSIMYWLCVYGDVTPTGIFRDDIVPTIRPDKLIESLQSLVERSLIEKNSTGFTQQPVIMEYTMDLLIDQISEEIQSGEITLFSSHALIKALSKDYIREIQVRLVLKPIVTKLVGNLGSEKGIVDQLIHILSTLKKDSTSKQGYAGGNILNLLCYLNANLEGLDFSHLAVRQAYLQDQSLYEVNFAHADLSKSVFAQTFSSVMAVAFSPESFEFNTKDLLAIGDATGEIHLRTSIEGQEVLIIKGHSNRVRDVTFNFDGGMLASSGDDRVIKVWDVASGRCLKSFNGHSDRVFSIAFSPIGSTLASGSHDETVRVWEIETEACLKTLIGHTDNVLSVAFRPDGAVLASSSADSTIRLWNLDTDECLQILEGHKGWVWSVAFEPDGELVATAGDDQTIRIWNSNSGECLNILTGHSGIICSLAFSPSDRMLASSSSDSTVKVWSLNTGKCLKTLTGHNGWVWSVAFNSDGTTLASGGDDQILKTWDIKTGQCFTTVKGSTNWVWSVAFSPDGQNLACGSEDQKVRIWDVRTRRLLRTLEGHTRRIWSVAFSPDREILASCSGDSTIRLWQIETGQWIKTLSGQQGHINRVKSVSFSPNGKILASCGDDQTVKIWDVQSGRCIRTLHEHTKWVWAVAFNPDGETIASGGDDCTIRIWDVETGECMKVIDNHNGCIWTLAFSPDGYTIAGGSNDKKIRIWDVHTVTCLKILEGHTDRVRSISFNPDGRTLASSSEDQTIRIWDVSSGQCIKVLEEHTDRVRSVAFSPDRKTIASGGEDTTIHLWDTKIDQLLPPLKPERLYERMDITAVIGLTEAQRTTLKILGAFEN